jgi:hypothetical protein
MIVAVGPIETVDALLEAIEPISVTRHKYNGAVTISEADRQYAVSLGMDVYDIEDNTNEID